VNKWKKTLPPMPTRRRAASATTLRNNLVVAGGIHEEDGKSYLSTVEVLDTEKQLWSRVCSLPKPTNFMSMTSCELTDRIYLLGGLSKQGSIRSVFSCVFTDLLNSASPSSDGEMTRDAKSEPDSRVWEDIAQTPYHRMGCITISGRLVVASGLDKGNQATRPVYVLDPISRKWETVGEMAAARSSCSLVSRGRGRLMVVGGYIDPRHWIASLTTDVMECINLKLE
jgi:N-acetylneuraminic acid mutarotase